MTSLNRAGRRRPLPAKKHFKKLPVQSQEAEIGNQAEETLEGLQARVQQLVDTFKFEEAREVCQKAVTIAPENADIQYLMGTICLEIGDFMNGFEVSTGLNIKYKYLFPFVVYSY